MEFQIEKNVLNRYIGDDTEVSVPKEVMIIGDNAFHERIHVKKVVLPDSITRIGNWAFSRCLNLAEIEIPEGVTSIGLSAFRSCSKLTKASFPETIEEINGKVFELCKSLQSFSFPSKIKSIGEKSFSFCVNLQSVLIPYGMTQIGSWAFEGCSSLCCIKIPDSIENIGENAFLECKSLEHIEFGKGIKKIGYNAFCETAWLKKQIDKYIMINGILIKYQGKDKNVVIPNHVKVIGCGAFEYCEELTCVTIHDTVSAIDEKAFEECIYLDTIKIDAKVKAINDSSFQFCKGIKHIFLMGYFENKKPPKPMCQTDENAYSTKTTCLYIYMPTTNYKLKFNDVITARGYGIEVNFEKYDEAFEYITDINNKTFMAITRLISPVGMEEQKSLQYYKYLNENVKNVCELLIRLGHFEYIKVIAAMSLLQEIFIDDLIALSLEMKNIEITSFLLDFKNGHFKVNSKEYSL